MLSLLFNLKAVYDFIIVIAIFIAIILCMKYPSARYVIVTVIVLCFMLFTAWCGVNLHYYFTAHGGIHGAISELYSFNTIVVDYDNLSMSIDDIVLMKEDDTDIYSSLSYSNDDFKFDVNDSYICYISEVPCQIKEYGSDYLMVDYNYEFLDYDKNVIYSDTLYLRFSFDNNCSVKIYTKGGSTAVKYWNNYFAKYGMTIRLEKVSNVNNHIFNDDIVRVFVQDYYINGRNQGAITGTVYYVNKGSSITNLKQPITNSSVYLFCGYAYTDAPTVYIDIANCKFTEDCTIYCVYNVVAESSITYHYLDGTTKTISYTSGSAVYENMLPELVVISTDESTAKERHFWSYDNCGEISEDEYSEHSAFLKYCYISNNIGGPSYISMGAFGNMDFYEAYYTYEDATIIITPGSSGMSGGLK